MGNTIGGPGNIPGDMNIYQFSRTARESAFQRGDIGNIGKQETKQQDEGKDTKDAFLKKGVKSVNYLDDGRTRTSFKDGSSRTRAKNGVRKERDQNDWINIDLPNGLYVEKRPDGETSVYDSNGGVFLKAQENFDDKTNQNVISFTDVDGNKWSVGERKLDFQVQNPSETLTQKVRTDGSVEISTKTLSRNPETGRFSQDTARIHISSDGTVTTKSSNLSSLEMNNGQLNFTARGDLDMGIKFPYQLPGNLKGDCVKPDLKPPAHSPQYPPSNCGPSMPPGQMPPVYSTPMPNMGMPGSPFVMDPIAQFPYPGYPGPGQMPPNPMDPSLNQPVNDPFSPMMTPSGLMRKHEPDGSMFISLSNGLLLNQMSDGQCQAFDSRFPDAVLPVTTSSVNSPGYGPEKQYNFRDGAGNMVTLFSNSADFQVVSKDGNLIQNVSANGDILINARTFKPGPDGEPVQKFHKVLVGANGRVNTFGEKGIQVNNKNIVFAGDGGMTNYALPYEIPLEQGLMPFIPPMGYQPPGQIPVPNPQYPCHYPYGEYQYKPGCQGFSTPPPDAKVILPQSEGQEGPRFVRVRQGKDGAYRPVEKQPRFEMGDDGILRTFDEPNPAEKDLPVVDANPDKSKSSKPEPPAEKPVKPGLWQRIKNFFNEDSDDGKQTKTGKPESGFHTNGYNQYHSGYFNPYGGMYPGMMGMGTAAMAGLTAGAMMGRAMMWPMGMYCNPFGAFGMYGMW